jgi:hypothetical protein
MDTLTPLEHAVLEKLLSGESDRYRVLQNQIPALLVAERKMTGVGFFTRLSLPDDAPILPDETTFQIGDVAADINDLKHGAGFVLFIEDWRIETLEGYTYKPIHMMSRGLGIFIASNFISTVRRKENDSNRRDAAVVKLINFVCHPDPRAFLLPLNHNRIFR